MSEIPARRKGVRRGKGQYPDCVTIGLDKMLAYEAILSDLDENVVCARSGKEALRCLLKQISAVILLDVNMPGMDGFETAALIRQRARSETTS